ncbi:MAG: hypothetical protein ABIG95_03330 [Candidatus Woesearchaeota archaeon]
MRPLIFALISFIIIAPLLANYVFLLDYVITPNIKIENIFYGFTAPTPSIIFSFVIRILNIFLSTNLIQKLIFFSIFFLSGYSMYCLTGKKTSSIYAGLLYMLNPWVYSRFMAGHIGHLLAYSVFPFAVKAIFDKKPEKFCLLVLIIGIFSLHFLILILSLFAIILLCTRFKGFNKPAMAIIFLLASSYWILPALTTRTAVSQITVDDLRAYSTQIGNINVITNSAMLYGFWRNPAYLQPRNIIPFVPYFLLFAVILYLAIRGYLACKNKYKAPIALAALLAILLGIGITYTPLQDFYLFLFNNIILMKVFREPQKFVALIAFAYAYFGGYGVDSILKRVNTNKVRVVTLLILALPILYTPTMFFSFWGQLKPGNYPADWYAINAQLNQDKQDFNVLFLPWHMYMDFKFNPNQDKRMANPAKNFFDRPIIQGDNVELGNIYSQSANPLSKSIEEAIRSNATTLGKSLKLFNIKYVILAKEVDYKQYALLFNQSDLILINETQNLYLFMNLHNVSKFYQSANLQTYTPLNYTMHSPIKYTINSNKRYLIFTEPYNPGWELGNNKPLPGYPIDIYNSTAAELEFKPFRLRVLGYIISILAFVYLLAKVILKPTQK